MIDAMQWFQLNGKKAMVTGGAAGLCYAMAEGLHLAGAEVVLVDRSPAVGEAAARLSGCKNIVEAVPAGNAVTLPQWGLTLDCGKAVPADVR